MIAKWVKGRVACGQRANTPPAEQVRLHYTLNNRNRLVRFDNAIGKARAGIGGNAAHRAFVRVKGKRKEPFLWEPKCLVETLLQDRGLALQSAPEFGFACCREGQTQLLLGAVDQRLNLAYRDRVWNKPAVFV